MQQHTIAGNTVYSFKDSDSLLLNKLLGNGNRVYKKYMEIYNRDNFSYFRTPHTMNPKSTGPGYQFEPENRELKLEFEKYICSILNTELKIVLEIRDMWYLFQTNEAWVQNPPHIHLTANMIAVMYLQLGSNDTIQFYDAENNFESYNPSLGEIVFFNGDVIHKPGPSTEGTRISVNAELNTPLEISY